MKSLKLDRHVRYQQKQIAHPSSGKETVKGSSVLTTVIQGRPCAWAHLNTEEYHQKLDITEGINYIKIL